MTVALWTATAWYILLSGGPVDTDLDALGSKYGLTRVTDAATGREVLRAPGLTLVVAPGLSMALWNGEPKALSRPCRIVGGRVVVPAEVESWFAGRPARRPGREPVVAAPPSHRERTPKNFRLVIDPGHGGVHTGGKGASGLMEKEVTLDVSLRLGKLLEEYGVDVVLTRTRDLHFDADVDDDLQKRIDIANRAKGDFFMSIHANWHPTASPRGFEVFVPRHLERSRLSSSTMAQEIESQFKRHLDTENRGIKEAGFRVLKGTVAPAVLVELEFLSNRRGEEELSDASHRQKLAGLLFAAIKSYIARR